MPNPPIRLAGENDQRRLPRRITFTAASLEKMPTPARGRVMVFDTRVPALALRITSTGSRSFYLYRRVNGRPVMYRLGGFEDMTIDQARTEATTLNAEAVRGVNPQDAKLAAREEPTFGQLWDRWLNEQIKPKRRPRTASEYARIGNVYLKPWRARAISTITFSAIDSLHRTIGSNAPFMANRVGAVLSSLFTWARKRRLIEDNPARGIDRFKEQSRERFIQPAEMPRFFKALEDEPNHDLRDMLKVLVFTGARRGNVESMKWPELDLKNAVWIIPDAKGGKTITLPLAQPAVDVLKARLKLRGTSEYVFASYGSTGHLVDLRGPWLAFRERAGMPDLRLHDLRRTLGSWAAGSGASMLTIGGALGHRSSQATAVYARLALDPVRQAVATATSAIVEAGKSKIRKH